MDKRCQTTILFFDDWYLAQREHLARHVGRPRIVARFSDPYLDVSYGYPSVFYDAGTGRWRCLYQGFLHTQYLRGDEEIASGNTLRYRAVPVLAESGDGLDWKIPDLTDVVSLPDRRTPHQVLPLARFREWGPAFCDDRAENPQERLKGFVSYGREQLTPAADLWVSPDGIHWHLPDGARWHPVGIDPAVSAVWNPRRGTYVLAARPSWGDRRIAVYETADWRTFSQPELALQADALDPPLAEIYGMPVFPYEGMFIGFLWVFRPDASIARPLKGYLGHIDCQLAYSLDGWHFQRGLRDPFIPNADPGEDGAGCVFPSSLVRAGDVLRIYSSSTRYEHGQRLSTPEALQDALLVHQLRLDGFVYLESEGGWGSLATRILFTKGPELSLNTQAPYGEVRAQVMDENGLPLPGYEYESCLPFTGDALAWRPEWRDGRRFGAVGSRVIRLGLRLLNARLYAMRGDFYAIGRTDQERFAARGVQPPPISSYWR